jgi:hypothetical protein
MLVRKNKSLHEVNKKFIINLFTRILWQVSTKFVKNSFVISKNIARSSKVFCKRFVRSSVRNY